MAADVTDLRRAIMLQQFLETLARGGTRYTEYIEAVFNTDTGDARLQRPELVTRNKFKVQVSEVLSTAETTGNPIGALKGHGIAVNGSEGESYYCREHGILITLTSITPTTAYYEGIHRNFSRKTWLDYFIPHFENIGEQAILNQELNYKQGMTPLNAAGTFGYIPRYSEYKYENDKVTGLLRTQLEFWHLGRRFNTSAPVPLNSSFITCEPSTRIFAYN